MSAFSRYLSAAAVAVLTIGWTSSITLVATATAAAAKSDNSGSSGSHGNSESKGNSGSNGNSGSHGKSDTRGHGQNGRAFGRYRDGKVPGYCTASFDRLGGLEVYNLAVTVVQGAQDALERAAARLPDSEIPGPQASSQDVLSLMAQIRAQPWSLRKISDLSLLQRQYDYLVAREDLGMKEAVQRQARQFASHGKPMSNAAKSVLQGDC